MTSATNTGYGPNLASLAQPVALCIGDSLTLGLHGTPYPQQAAALSNGSRFRWLNKGIGASTTSGWINSLYSTSGHPSTLPVTGVNAYCFVWLGTNDILFGATDTTIKANLTTIYGLCNTDSAKSVVPITILPCTQFNSTQNGYQASVNSWIASLGVTYIDAASALPNPSFQPPYFTDGTHLVTAGYGTVAALVNSAIPSLP